MMMQTIIITISTTGKTITRYMIAFIQKIIKFFVNSKKIFFLKFMFDNKF